MKTIESYLPIFTGFYGTYFEPDNVMENILEEEDVDYENVKWDIKDYMERVAHSAIGSIENYLIHDGFAIKIDFEDIYSPHEYNFRNDVISCTYKVNQEDFNILLDYLKGNISEFDAFVKKNYSSRSGFVSFFDTDLDTWFDEYLKDDSDKFATAFVGVLEFYLQNEQYTIDDMESDCQSETSYIDYEILTQS